MYPRLLPLLVMVAVGCSQAAVDASRKPPATTNGAMEAGARDVTRGGRPWAAEDRRIPPGKERFTGELFAELPFVTRSGAPQRVSANALGFLDFAPGEYAGARVLATRKRVQRMNEPNDLVRFCVARDGRATFAVEQGNKLLHAPSFDAPMRALGTLETESNGAYFVVNEGKRSFIDCRRGSVEDISNLRGHPRILFHSEVVTLLALQEEQRRSCRMRAGSAAAWEDVPRCTYANILADGLVRVFADTPDGTLTKCAFEIGADGKRRPCRDHEPTPHPAPTGSLIDFRLARFAAQDLIVVVGEKGLYGMPPTGGRADLKLIAPGRCRPVLPVGPLFRCMSDDGRTERIVGVDAGGKAKDELTFSIRSGDEARRFFEAAGGAVAIGGACDGTIGDVACVRQPSGDWKTIPFAPEVVAALHRTAPETLLFPTVSGELYIATGVSEAGGPLAFGPVDLLVYKADQGLVTRIGKVPTWIIGDMAGPSGLASTLRSGGMPHGTDPSFLWRSATTFSMWPLVRPHPVFRTPESCRFDVSLDGSTRASCVSGTAHAVGRFGVVERKLGELLETYDGGESFSQVPLPEGVDTRDVECAAIGCRIGPYFRLGWGL